MNKKVLLISGVLLTLGFITIILFNSMDNKDNGIISNINKNKQVINSNMLTLMYETVSGSGEYTETKDTTWPESGYIFNETLSGCENGGELEYNSQNNTVNLLSNSSDRCYVYFDKYDGVWIDNVVATNVTGSSITLDVSATSENGNITTYYYSLNDSEYVSSSTNPIVIDNLNKLTEYNIKIYAIDNTGARSNIYELNVTTTDISVPVIKSVSVSDITYDGFTLTTNVTSDTEIERYYYIIESNNISGTNISNSYTFVDLDSETSYSLIVFVEDINGIFSNKYNISVETAEPPIRLADHVMGLYTYQGSNGIYYHTSSLANSAGDDSYRYAGSNPNNYVCFGSDSVPCPSDNLYRIIGVFNEQVKLIKSGSYSTSSWSGDYVYNNTWSSSAMADTLNESYLNSFDTKWQDVISSHTWKVGGLDIGNAYRTFYANTVYNYEVGNYSDYTTWNGKIGLMYASDYAFAISNSYWRTEVTSSSYGNVANNNWLFEGSDEWTISRDSSSNSGAIMISSSGFLDDGYGVTNKYRIRPCFYLNSDVKYISGSGTESDSYRIGI